MQFLLAVMAAVAAVLFLVAGNIVVGLLLFAIALIIYSVGPRHSNRL